MSKITKSFSYGDHIVTLETGEIARQADGAVLVDMGETSVLVTAVARSEPDPNRGFFPLTINYQEKTYAAGKIPGGFFKREGRPSEKETMTSRLIDRPLRPMFPKGFMNDVQIIATVVSMNTAIDPDIPALLGASAALAVSGIPFNGPIGAARVGYVDDNYVLNPDNYQLKSSRLDLIVAGTKGAVLMVESEADILPQETMLGAVMFGHEQLQKAIQAIEEFAQEVNKPAWNWQAPQADESLADRVNTKCREVLGEAYQIAEKVERQSKVGEIRNQLVDSLMSGAESKDEAEILGAFSKLEKDIVRGRILAGEPRIDGRDRNTVRPISIRVGVLPRVHGSALFTRGETQALVTTTLGTGRDAQVVDAIEGEFKDNFMLHYNFPPFCVGETGMVGSPKRREIGHGKLTKRGIRAVVPTGDDFPYVIRVVSEITESNGSSSMASVCGTSLSLMDSGVPIKAPVAGIAMGLIKEGENFAVLTDILGDEDHLGDMDFKVAGTDQGITALQMDIKIEGITKEIMEIALSQAREGLTHILGEMNAVIPASREDMSEHAPRFTVLKINPDKIRDVIGKGGAVIRALTEETGTTIDIDDDGVVRIASVDKAAGDDAKRRIEDITADVEVGKIYEGKVVKIMDFGAFVSVLPGKDGLVHISQISHERVDSVSDELTEGDIIKVKVLEIDKQGRVRLSMKAIENEYS